ncbi:adenosylcobinamide-GDP ribazoletransferase [Haliangium sp.]
MQDARTRWMTRLGPLYPGLVALGCLTRLPAPGSSSTMPEDLPRGGAWVPVAAALLGALMAGVAIGAASLGLVPAVAGALALTVGAALTGGLHEAGLAYVAERMVSRTSASADERERRTAGTLAVLATVALRALALLGCGVAVWPAALVVAPVAARWGAVLLAQLGHLAGAPADQPDRVRATLVLGPMSSLGLIAGSLVTAVVAVGMGGSVGLAAAVAGMLTCGLGGRVAHRLAGRLSRPVVTALVVVAELVALLVFASLHPAQVSPWLAP